MTPRRPGVRKSHSVSPLAFHIPPGPLWQVAIHAALGVSVPIAVMTDAERGATGIFHLSG